MDIILSFAALRPRSGPDPLLNLTTYTSFQEGLRAASAGEHASTDAIAAALQFSQDGGFVDSPEDVAYGIQLINLLDRLLREGALDLETLTADARKAVEETTPDVWRADDDRARDSVVAAYLLGNRAPSADVAQRLVRVYTLAGIVLTGTPPMAQIEAILRSPMELPEYLLQLRDSTDAPPAPPSPEQTVRELAEQINTLAARRQDLASTLEEIGLHAEDELVLSERGERLPLDRLYQTINREERHPAVLDKLGGPAPARLPVEAPDRPESVSRLLRASALRNVLFSSAAIEVLPAQVTDTLRSLDLDPGTMAVAEMHHSLAREHAQAGQKLLGLSGQYAAFKKFGFADIVDPLPSIDFLWDLDPVDEPESPAPVNTVAPTTFSSIKPLGVADLLLVRTHISHYERGEVAALENILAHEKLTHTVRRLDSMDTTTTDDSETTDLRSQTQSIAEQDSGHTTVQAVGPGIGPVAAEGPSSFARSVTDQVSSSTSNRRRRLAVQRQLREREESFEHLLDNTAGENTSYGVYQWLDKVYAAQTFRYGSRLLYDIVVPDPAALFREALARPRSGTPLPSRPARFTLAPTKLSIDNWTYYVAGHHASGVDAPPPPEIVVTEPLGGRSKDSFSTDAVTNTFVTAECRTTRIPKGYQAARFRMTVQASGYNAGILLANIGAKHVQITPIHGTYIRDGALSGETESLPVGIIVDADGVNSGAQTVTVGIEIICERTEELFTAWQVKAHGAILEANQRRFQEYEERVANRDASAKIFLQSLSASRKRSIAHTDVKRAALSVLTGQNFSGFNATTNDALGFPFHPAATKALAPYIRFFEQAVEWEHLAYAFYPYFWGAQSSWLSKLLTTEGDSQFASFLTAGAARVVLPIRRGYEAAFETFVNTGVTPTTDQLLDVGSPLWVSLVSQLRSESAEDGLETPVGEPWQFRIASDLVRARADNAMPRWTLSQGEWHDDADPSF